MHIPKLNFWFTSKAKIILFNNFNYMYLVEKLVLPIRNLNLNYTYLINFLMYKWMIPSRYLY